MELKKKSMNEKMSLTYAIQNIVVKMNLNLDPNLELHLEEISKKISNTTFEKDRFPGLFLKFYSPKCSVILFRNGKVILAGLKLFEDIQKVIESIIHELTININLKINKDKISSEVVNIVITANLFNKIDLNLAALKMNNVVFEPEVFPALIYKSENPVKCVFLVFNNGKIVLTGINKKEMIEPALINFGKLIKKENLFT
jgi:transcription initiation factor TFIID TATA-box-binding protein